jgi:hypothetical protein
VTTRLERRGFTAARTRVVEAVGEQRQRPFALVAATSASGRTCFVPVRGISLGATLCHMTKPVVLWTAPDHWHHLRLTNVLGVARRDVVGISIDQRSGGYPHTQGLPLIEDSGRLTFAGGFADASVLRARDARGRVLFRLIFSR